LSTGCRQKRKKADCLYFALDKKQQGTEIVQKCCKNLVDCEKLKNCFGIDISFEIREGSQLRNFHE
jgi:hypothetical protein